LGEKKERKGKKRRNSRRKLSLQGWGRSEE